MQPLALSSQHHMRAGASRAGIGATWRMQSAGPYVAVVLGMTSVAVVLRAMGHELPYQAIVGSIAILTVLWGLASHLRQRHRPAAWLGVAGGLGIAAMGILVNGALSGNHLYVAFLIGLVAVVVGDRGFRYREALRVTNAWYLAYLIGSLLVYVGWLDLGRGLNVFDATDRVPWLGFRTFVGLYGSTAHIDSISLFVAILNAAFGRGRGRWGMVAVALAASLAAVRLTPFASLALTGLVVAGWSSLRSVPSLQRLVVATLAVLTVASAFVAVLVVRVTGSTTIEGLLNRATSGRVLIWETMLDAAAARLSWAQWLFGVGSTDPILTVGGWPRIHPITRTLETMWTANPHNSYLTVALTWGIPAFLVVAAVIVVGMVRVRSRRALLVLAYLVAVGITNAELFTFQFPVIAVWFTLLVRDTTVPAERPRTLPRGATTTPESA